MESLDEIFHLLESGQLRAATKENGVWTPNKKVKMAILKAFQTGRLEERPGGVDAHNLRPRRFTVAHGIRLVDGGTSIRRGAFVGPGVVVMPPSFINVGAYVGKDSLIDSHVLVGSCAQIGQRVHLSAGVQVGGVLEPIRQAPVVVEDDAFLGAGSIVVEGIQVGEGAVVAPGVVLSQSIPIYDALESKLLPKAHPVPPGAIIVPGARARGPGVFLQCPVLIKYRDAKADASLTLEKALRNFS